MRRLRNALLHHYDRHARDLPWRRSRDPYAIWVSEVMLQQTRVDTVVRYYERFLERFPTLEILAAASEDEVLSAWSGLGYYRRARLLHAGVREARARYGSRVPRSAEARRSLPGVGRYTAGAIGSIAFDLPEPVVDGNVARVLSRIYAIDGPPQGAEVQRKLWSHAEALVQGPRPGTLNQALMELGATLCTPGQPDCQRCPAARHCRARAEGRSAELPRPRARPSPRPQPLTLLLASRGRGGERQVYLVRGGGSLFGGLWNLPMVEGHGRTLALALARDHGLAGSLSAAPLCQLEHVLTHRRLQVQLWHLARVRELPGCDAEAVAVREFEARGTSRLTHRALQAASILPPPPDSDRV
ncbi:MAG: A/G-specific adenine glycosylase [Myxococcales bacterium]|nr:A/G-specific adenine glycosylase [Myxococcales bacterium]